jgi:hypothetical protein
VKRWFLIWANAKALAFVAYLAVLVVARPWYRHWGSTAAERLEALPGDEHAGNPARAADRAITISAPAHEVWPWLAQMGQDRGGFYSYDWLERCFGLPIRNAERVVPEWQNIAAGGFVRAAPRDWLGGAFGERVGWEVDHVVASRVLALRYWIFEVEAVDSATSRLHVRTHSGDPPVPAAPLMLITFEPAHFIMERAMLRGIKERVEASFHGGA